MWQSLTIVGITAPAASIRLCGLRINRPLPARAGSDVEQRGGENLCAHTAGAFVLSPVVML